jgi:hypothetical protein
MMNLDQISNDPPASPPESPASTGAHASHAAAAAGSARAERPPVVPMPGDAQAIIAATEPGSDALAGLAPIGLEDAGHFTAAAEAGKAVSWSHFFPYLHLSGRPASGRRLLHEFHGESALVYRVERKGEGERLSLLLAPFPFSLPALRHASERMRSFNGRRGARIVRMQQDEALRVARAGFEVRHHSDEYIYDADAVRSLQGSAFATLRRKIARYADGAAAVRPYRTADEPACRALLDAWRADLRQMGVIVGPYNRYTRACLAGHDGFAPTQLVGQVVEVEGEIAAFSFGGAITPTHASVFITVADRRHPGLAYFQRKSLIDGLSAYRHFNDFNDSKRAGLMQMKRSFRPAAMHSLFVAREG